MPQLPATVEVIVEVPRWGFVKRGAAGEREFASPVPCPFNYGSVVGHDAPDGDLQDALVLGARLRVGTRVSVHLWGVVRFVDDDHPDDKWICGEHPPSRAQERLIFAFFWTYARCKWLLNRAGGRSGTTRFIGVERTTEEAGVG